MHLIDGAKRWMGLDASQHPPSEEIPRWQGVERKRVAKAQLAWIVTGIAVFGFLRLLTPTDDFSGYMPMIGASLIFALGITFTERHMIRANPDRKAQDYTQDD